MSQITSLEMENGCCINFSSLSKGCFGSATSFSLQGLHHESQEVEGCTARCCLGASHLHTPPEECRSLASRLINVSLFRMPRERQCWALNLEPLAPGPCSLLWENRSQPAGTLTLTSAVGDLGESLAFLAAVNEASWLVKTGDHGRSCSRCGKSRLRLIRTGRH